MNLNPNGVAQLNQAIAAEVRAEIARQKLQAHTLRHPQTPATSPEPEPSEPEPLADEAEAGMWQAVLDHKARCVACDTLLQAQTHLTQLALTEEERYLQHLRRLARADATSRTMEYAS